MPGAHDLREEQGLGTGEVVAREQGPGQGGSCVETEAEAWSFQRARGTHCSFRETVSGGGLERGRAGV